MLQGERYEQPALRSHASTLNTQAYTHAPEQFFHTASGLPAALDYKCGVGFEDAAPTGPIAAGMSSSTVMPFANGAHVSFNMQQAPMGMQPAAAPAMQCAESLNKSEPVIASVDPTDAAVSIAASFVQGATQPMPRQAAKTQKGLQTQVPKQVSKQVPKQSKAPMQQSDDINMLKGKVQDMHEGLLNHTKVLKSMGQQMQKHQASITQYDAGLKNHKEALVSTQKQIKEMDFGLKHHTEVLSNHAKQHKVASSAMQAQAEALGKYGVDISAHSKQLGSMHTGLLKQKSCVENIQKNLQNVQSNVQSQLKQHKTFITRQRKAEAEVAPVVALGKNVDSKANKKKVVSAGEMAKQMQSLAQSMQALQA